MRRTRFVVLALLALCGAASAHERCDCDRPLVLNGRLNTSDFDGGVGDRFGDGGTAYGGGYVIAYGGAGAFAGGAASASASARASASVSVSTHFGGSFHGGGHGMHGGGMHGGFGGHH